MITRRDFLKGAAAGAAGAAALGMLGGAAMAAGTEAPAELSADEVIDVDVLVCGCGVSGMMAACAAGKGGAKVLAIDPALSIAGTNACSIAGSWGIEDRDQVQQPGYMTKEEFFNHIYGGTHFQSNAQLLSHMMYASAGVWDCMYDAEVSIYQEFMGTTPESTILARSGHVYMKRGAERGEEFARMLEMHNAPCMWGTRAVALITDEKGAVTGAFAQDGERTYQINARGGVVLACGGFVHNPEMVAQYYSGCRMTSRSSTFCDGSGIKLAQSVGGAITKNFSISVNEGGGVNELSSNSSNAMHKLPLLGNLIVNKAGKRFMNEEAMCQKTMFCGDPIIREGGKYYMLADKDMMDTLSTTPLGEFLGEAAVMNLAPQLRESFVPMVLESIFDDAEEAVAEGWGWKGDTIEELAEAAGMPELPATVSAYNAYCEAGADEEMFKPAEYLRPVKTGPIYMVESQISAWVTCGGIKSDGDCRAMTAEMTPIEGLYVCGADCDCWSVPYYQGGTTSGFSLASGYIAGEAAAARAKA